MYNSGVKLAIDGSAVLTDLKKLQNVGVEIFVNDMSLEYYGLKDKLAVGKLISMADLIKIQVGARKIIKL